MVFPTPHVIAAARVADVCSAAVRAAQICRTVWRAHCSLPSPGRFLSVWLARYVGHLSLCTVQSVSHSVPVSRYPDGWIAVDSDVGRVGAG
eukprot:COSAG01_NODE_3870_length_5605_cov_4.345260_3_plen_91_part_00